MAIQLTAECERLIEEKVASGRYTSPSEVVRAALGLLDEQELSRQARFEELRRDIRVGLDEADRGELIPAEEVFRELEERHEAFVRRSDAAV